jgi:hypothetical protein
MRTISDLLGRKSVASTSTVYAVPIAKPSPRAEEPVEPTLADIGARVGEDNETLRNLLIDTDRRIGALDDLKEAFRNLVEPIGAALYALEQKKPTISACATRSPSFAPATRPCAATTVRSKSGRRNWKTPARSCAGN